MVVVDYYYGRWQPGRVHEVLLHPKHSSKFGVYQTQSGPWAGQNPALFNGRYVEGVEWLSGGAMPPFDFHKSSFQDPSPMLWSGSFRANGELHDAYGGDAIFAPPDPEFLNDGVSIKAQHAAVNGGNPGSGSIDVGVVGGGVGTPIAGDRSGKLGWAHFGHYRPWVGMLNEYSANHEELWQFAGESLVLFSIVDGMVWFRNGPTLDHNTASSSWSTAGLYGVGPDVDDWPEGVRQVEVQGTDRELLDVKINSNLAPGFRLIQKKPGREDHIDFPGPLKPALEKYGRLDITVEDWENYWAKLGDGDAGYYQRMELAVVPEIPEPTMMYTTAPMGPTHAYLQESLIEQTHDYSVYVKFRTAPWRYVYEIEPSIEGKPDIVRRRFV